MEFIIYASLAIAGTYISLQIALILMVSLFTPIISIFNKDLAFGIRCELAKRFSVYTTESFCSTHGIPKARVKYPDGKISKNMPIGNAFEYKNIFGGTVIKPR